MRALLSVYDKTGLETFARGLVDLGWDLVSTGGTFQTLAEAGLPVLSVADVTGFPEMLDGRVKTLHPVIHGGILARRDRGDHMRQLEAHDVRPIDLVAGNLYPFEATIRAPGVSDDDAVEQIDIGGPAMIRAAAKNFSSVVVLTDPSDYGAVLAKLRAGGPSQPERREFAAKAFGHVSAYDALVAEYLRGDSDSAASEFPANVSIAGRLERNLRYGENPHQRAAAYRRVAVPPQRSGILDAVQLGGKELSFNNMVDTDAAWAAAWLPPRPTAAVVKHAIPCGLASRDLLAEAFDLAVAGDPISAFGGIVALNRTVDPETAERISRTFFEVVVAPGFDDVALEILTAKRNLRVLRLDPPTPVENGAWDIRPITGGFLLQDADDVADGTDAWTNPTRREPTDAERRDLVFAWAAVRLIKSNAIVLVRDEAVVGVGSGQPNRLESVAIAARRSGDRSTGSVLASDAFFPFPDGIEAAAKAGVTAIVQPGGSIRDDQVLAAADAAGIAMVFTGTRHFRH